MIGISGVRGQTLRGLGRVWGWKNCWFEGDGGVVGVKGLLLYGAWGGHGDLQISDVLEVWCFLKYCFREADIQDDCI